MTGRALPYIVCDYQTSPTCWSLVSPQHDALWGEVGERHDRIRGRLRALGWTRPSHGCDACPSCSRVDVTAVRAGEAAR